MEQQKPVVAVTLLCVLAAGCAQVGEQVPPSLGGLPADTPPRAQVVAPTPAVHDLPPARPQQPLDDAQQLRLQKELAGARTRQEKLQDPNARRRGEDAGAATAAARDKAKAAAKPQSN